MSVRARNSDLTANARLARAFLHRAMSRTSQASSTPGAMPARRSRPASRTPPIGVRFASTSTATEAAMLLPRVSIPGIARMGGAVLSLVASLALAQPADGAYAGRTRQGRAIEVTVTGGAITRYAITYFC